MRSVSARLGAIGDGLTYSSPMTVETPHPFTPEDVFAMQWLHSADLSPNGEQVVYALSTYNPETDKDETQLWLLDVASDQTRQLTHTANNSQPVWSPDGREILFVSDRIDETNQLFVLSAEFGEARQLTTLEQGVKGRGAWSPDGSSVVFVAGREYKEEADKPFRVSRTIYRFDGIGYVHRALSDVFICHLADGTVTQLTQHDAVCANPRWSPDGSHILYNLLLRDGQFASAFATLVVVDTAGIQRAIVSADQFRGLTGSWLPNSEGIVFAGVPVEKPNGSKLDLYVMQLDDDSSPINRTPNLAVGVCGGVSGDMPALVLSSPSQIIPVDNGTALVEVQRGGVVEVMRVALSGDEQHEVILAGERRHKLLGYADGKLLYVTGEINRPIDLYICNLDGSDERKLTAHNDDLISKRTPATVEHLLFDSIDGVQVEGWLIMPATGNAPYPTILYIHGGPHSAYGHQFRFDTQMLVGAGYAVLLINHRASTGYGDTFATAIKGDWGNLDYQDLMHGVDEVIRRGLTDPDKLGVCGLSGGGNLSCWIVGHTDRFKAAVPENPVTNWMSFYGTSDIGVWFALEELGGHPHEIPEVYTKCSPITYAHRCTTPTLMVQGEHDWRCPAEQSEQFYTVLKANGCIVEMIRFPASPHAGSIIGTPAIRRVQNETLLDWMNTYVL